MKQNKKQPHLPATKTTLPLEIAGLSYHGRTEYTDPTTGIQLRFDDGNRSRADVYLYPTETKSPDVTAHYFLCANEILDSEDKYRTYTDLLHQQVLHIDKHRFMVSWFLLQDQPDEEYQYSMLALTECNEHYLKLRYSIRLPMVRRCLNLDVLEKLMLDFLGAI